MIISTVANSDGKMVMDSILTAAAVDTITVPGLRKVLGVMVCMNDNPVDGFSWVNGAFGGSLADNQITIASWQNTTGTDPTPVAAAVFGKRVTYVAFGY